MMLAEVVNVHFLQVHAEEARGNVTCSQRADKVRSLPHCLTVDVSQNGCAA